MFTGIVEAKGRIRQMAPVSGDMHIVIETGGLDLTDVALGDSIAVNGVCLTVVELSAGCFSADVSLETLGRTSLNRCTPGMSVNLEKALLPTTRMGGHLVSGHVDGLGKILEREESARSIRFRVQAPDSLARYIACKGSICVDGISLTVNEVQGAVFDLNIVPHTARETTVGDWAPGTEVNIEIDLIARYLERLLLGDRAADTGNPDNPDVGITQAFLQAHGFAGPDS